MGSQADGIEFQVCRSHFKAGEVIKANPVEAPIAKMIQGKIAGGPAGALSAWQISISSAPGMSQPLATAASPN